MSSHLHDCPICDRSWDRYDHTGCHSERFRRAGRTAAHASERAVLDAVSLPSVEFPSGFLPHASVVRCTELGLPGVPRLALDVAVHFGNFETDTAVHVMPCDAEGTPLGGHVADATCDCGPVVDPKSFDWPRVLYVHRLGCSP